MLRARVSSSLFSRAIVTPTYGFPIRSIVAVTATTAENDVRNDYGFTTVSADVAPI